MNKKHIKCGYLKTLFNKNIISNYSIHLLKNQLYKFWKKGYIDDIFKNDKNIYLLVIKNCVIYNYSLNESIIEYCYYNDCNYIAGFISFLYIDKIKYIDLLDTLLRGYNIGELIIKQYTNKYKIEKLIPSLIIKNSSCYWERHLSKNYNLYCVNDYLSFICNNLFGNVNWDFLIELKTKQEKENILMMLQDINIS